MLGDILLVRMLSESLDNSYRTSNVETEKHVNLIVILFLSDRWNVGSVVWLTCSQSERVDYLDSLDSFHKKPRVSRQTVEEYSGELARS
jgi:hypothetical protein